MSRRTPDATECTPARAASRSVRNLREPVGWKVQSEILRKIFREERHHSTLLALFLLSAIGVDVASADDKFILATGREIRGSMRSILMRH